MKEEREFPGYEKEYKIGGEMGVLGGQTLLIVYPTFFFLENSVFFTCVTVVTFIWQ